MEETTLSYHQLTTGFLAASCRRTGEPTYCDAARRFARYEHEPPRIGLGGLHRLWAKRAAPLRFSLSKGSAVAVRVYGPRGLVLARDLELGRGGHELSFTPPSRGRFRVRVSARGPEGKVGFAQEQVKVALPRPQPRRLASRGARPRKPPEQLRGETTRGGEVAAGLGG
jgi:hypothetical protein